MLAVAAAVRCFVNSYNSDVTTINPRKIEGPWPVRMVEAPHRARDFAFFTAKDAAMAGEADVGLALWDGQSSGTIVNLARLVARSKPAVVYVAPTNTFFTLKTPDDLAGFLSSANTDVRERVAAYIHDHVAEFAQPQMF